MLRPSLKHPFSAVKPLVTLFWALPLAIPLGQPYVFMESLYLGNSARVLFGENLMTVIDITPRALLVRASGALGLFFLLSLAFASWNDWEISRTEYPLPFWVVGVPILFAATFSAWLALKAYRDEPPQAAFWWLTGLGIAAVLGSVFLPGDYIGLTFTTFGIAAMCVGLWKLGYR